MMSTPARTHLSAPAARALSLSLALSLGVSLALASSRAVHAQSLREDGVAPMGDWLVFKETVFDGQPVLIHLRQGYERAVVFPEPVRMADDGARLPNCAIEIDGDIVGFYPQDGFERQALVFAGLDSGRRFTLLVSASETGLRQPLEIIDP